MADFLIKKRAVWHYKRRVPAHLVKFDPRGFVQKSTGSKDRTEAGLIAREINAETEEFWATLEASNGRQGEAAKYEAAVARSKHYNMDYRTVDELAAGPIDELLSRIELLEKLDLVNQEPARQAILGGVNKPDIPLSELIDRYFAMTRDVRVGKSDDQIRKWENPRIKAVNNLIAVVGNKSLQSITRDDALLFREWWQDRVLEDGLKAGSANKDIGSLNAMINEVSDKLRLNLSRPFAGMRLKETDQKRRASFKSEFIQEQLLAPGVLDGLNEQARLLVYLMIETGMRLSEMVTLTSKTIILDHDVPHVSIKQTTRQLKTSNSQRTIPLVGISLAAARCAINRFGGFPKYAHTPDTLSAAANKYLRRAGLLPEPDLSLYSLRHSFDARLTAAKAPKRVQVDLMGHSLDRPKYGDDSALELKQEYLLKMQFKVSQAEPPSEIIRPFLKN